MSGAALMPTMRVDSVGPIAPQMEVEALLDAATRYQFHLACHWAWNEWKRG